MFMVLHERGIIRAHFTYDVCCRFSFNIQRAIIRRTLRDAYSIPDMFLPTDNSEPSGRDWLLGWLFGTESEASGSAGTESGTVDDEGSTVESGSTSGEDSEGAV
jgi:hypothetical protein